MPLRLRVDSSKHKVRKQSGDGDPTIECAVINAYSYYILQHTKNRDKVAIADASLFTELSSELDMAKRKEQSLDYRSGLVNPKTEYIIFPIFNSDKRHWLLLSVELKQRDITIIESIKDWRKPMMMVQYIQCLWYVF